MSQKTFYPRAISFFVFCLSLVSIAQATIVTASVSTIAWVDSYTSYGSGDVIFALTNNSLASSCPYGFWIRGTDAGAKTAVAQVIAALQTGSPVTVSADNSTTWAGAASAACLVWDIRVS